MPLKGTGNVRRCCLVGTGVALLEEVCRSGQALRFQTLQPGPVSLSVPAACRYSVDLLAPLQRHVCLRAETLPAMMTMG